MASLVVESAPNPAAVVSGVESPLGQRACRALAQAGYRLCLMHPDVSVATRLAEQLPFFERLSHVAVAADAARPGSVGDAAREAAAKLGHVTALVVAVDLASEASEASLDPTQLAADLQTGAGALLESALALMPEMLSTQTGCIAALLSAPGDGTSPLATGLHAGVRLGALLGAVAQLARECDGTALRAIALCDDTGSIVGAAAARLVGQLGEEADLDNGHFQRLAVGGARGPIRWLERPAAPPPAAGGVVAAPPAAAAGIPAELSEKLAQTFRSAFGLSPGMDVSNCAIESVDKWDSLGHLKLMMEVEQSLRVRLPAESLSAIRSYRDLESAVRAVLPAQ